MRHAGDERERMSSDDGPHRDRLEHIVFFDRGVTVFAMTDLLEQALGAVRAMPASAQDEIARVVLRLATDDDGTSPVTLSPGERAAIATSKAASGRGEFASDADVRAVWAKHGL